MASARMENSECASCPVSQFKLECIHVLSLAGLGAAATLAQA